MALRRISPWHGYGLIAFPHSNNNARQEFGLDPITTVPDLPVRQMFCSTLAKAVAICTFGWNHSTNTDFISTPPTVTFTRTVSFASSSTVSVVTPSTKGF